MSLGSQLQFLEPGSDKNTYQIAVEPALMGVIPTG